MFISLHVFIEMFRVLFPLYPFQIDLNSSNYRVVIRTDFCTRMCFFLSNTVSNSGMYHYVFDLIPRFVIGTNQCAATKVN